MKTINFCGDSFACMDGPTEVKLLMWQSILAKKLNCTITGTGKSGTAYEHAIKSFDAKTDYTIFCWTDSARLWTKENIPMSFTLADKQKGKDKRYAAAYLYYKYLWDEQYCEQRYYRDLYWFDHAVLSEYKGLIIHLPCFDNIYQFTHGINQQHKLFNFSFSRHAKTKSKEPEFANHLTKHENAMLADKLYNIIKQHV